MHLHKICILVDPSNRMAVSVSSNLSNSLGKMSTDKQQYSTSGQANKMRNFNFSSLTRAGGRCDVCMQEKPMPDEGEVDTILSYNPKNLPALIVVLSVRN